LTRLIGLENQDWFDWKKPIDLIDLIGLIGNQHFAPI